MMPDDVTECTECGMPMRGMSGGLCEDCDEMLDRSGQAAVGRLTAENTDYRADLDAIRAIIHDVYVSPTRMPTDAERAIMQRFIARCDFEPGPSLDRFARYVIDGPTTRSDDRIFDDDYEHVCEACDHWIVGYGPCPYCRLTAERDAAIARAERAEAVIAAARHALDDDVLSWVDNDAEIWASVRLTRHARLYDALAAYDKCNAG